MAFTSLPPRSVQPPEITPFTYPDGITNMEILRHFKRWIDHIEKNVADALGSFGDDINAELAALRNDVEAALAAGKDYTDDEIAAMVSYVDTAVQQIINNSIEVQDPVVAQLIEDSGSDTRTKLNATFADKDTQTTVESGRLSETQLNDALLNKFTVGVKPELYGAVGDGVTDDTDAFAALLQDGHTVIDLDAKTYLIDADTIIIPPGGAIRGVGSGNFIHGDTVNNSRLLIKANSGTNGVYIGTHGMISGVSVYAENWEEIPYYVADFPINVATIPNGVVLADRGTQAVDVAVMGFSGKGITAGLTNTLDRVQVRSCTVGFSIEGHDGRMTSSGAMFCYDAGVDASAAFWLYTNNRIEWNARYGIISAAHARGTGNLFDRNGWAGLFTKDASWNQNWVGNHFHRNGCGGDGVSGRWGWAVPEHPGYVETPPEESCHVKVNYQRGVNIVGNRFSSGRDDANQGVRAPAFIFSSTTTSTGRNVNCVGNSGLFGSSDTLGYNADLYGGVGAIAGGLDTVLIEHLSSPFSPQDGVKLNALAQANGFAPTRGQSPNVSAYNINVEAGRSGVVTLSGRSETHSLLSQLYWSQTTEGDNITVEYVNLIGEMLAGATIINNGAEDRITIASAGSKSYNYKIDYASNAYL